MAIAGKLAWVSSFATCRSTFWPNSVLLARWASSLPRSPNALTFYLIRSSSLFSCSSFIDRNGGSKRSIEWFGCWCSAPRLFLFPLDSSVLARLAEIQASFSIGSQLLMKSIDRNLEALMSYKSLSLFQSPFSFWFSQFVACGLIAFSCPFKLTIAEL